MILAKIFFPDDKNTLPFVFSIFFPVFSSSELVGGEQVHTNRLYTVAAMNFSSVGRNVSEYIVYIA